MTEDTFPIIQKVVQELAYLVIPTYGPSKNTVMINGKVLDDGYKIAKQFVLEDKVENDVLNVIKQVALQTEEDEFDGTTGSIIMLHGIIGACNKDSDIKLLKNGYEYFKDIIKSKVSKITTQEELTKVAKVSCNDDKLADMIGKIAFKIGEDGYVLVTEGNEPETSYDIVNGFQIKSGHGFNSEVEMDNCFVSVLAGKVRGSDVVPLLEKLPEGNKNLVIIGGEFHNEVGDLLRVNKAKVVLVPGVHSKELLQDISDIVGGKEVEKVIISKNKTNIIGGKGDVSLKVEELKKFNSDSPFEKELVKERIAMLLGKLAIIKVGGKTPDELAITKDKVVDSINSTRKAYKSGVVRGGGVELSEITTSSEVLNEALKLPKKILEQNGATDEVLDAVSVLISGVGNAVSISSILLSIKRIC